MKNKKRGFSLIEVAIVLSIIGVLAGFAIKGRDLMESAKVRSLISQIESYRSATQIFFEKYGAVPGDLKDAKQIDDKCENGKQDGKIETLEDVKRFWNHLIKSNLISANLVDGIPNTKLGGILSVSSKLENKNGIWLVFCNNTADNAKFTGIATKEMAIKINREMDNGELDSGDVQAGQDGDKYYIMFRIW